VPIPLPTDPVEPGQRPMEQPISAGSGSVLPDAANPSNGPAPIPEGKTSVSSSAGPEHPQNELESPVVAMEAEYGISLIAATAKTLYRPISQIPTPLPRSEGLLIVENAEPGESVGKSTSGDIAAVTDAQSFIQDIDKLRDEVTQQTYLEKIAVGSTFAATTGLSIGYVLWLLRGEVLLTSLLASLPAWRMIDPLPVLASLSRRSDEDQRDDDSIEVAVKKGGEAPLGSLPKPQGGARSVKWRMVVQSADSVMENNL
jgi:hypothetical protein